MTQTKNPVLGTIQCGDCGEQATVHQTARGKGRYLYKRCACGCDQRNGAAVQKKLWTQTNWRDSAQPVRPPNVPEEAGAEPEPEPNNEPGQPAQESEPEPSKNPVKAGPLAFLGVVIVGLLAIAS